MSEHETQGDAVTKVARDLTAIEDMTAALLTQAIHSANDRELPGGAAMVALAGVASPEAWENVFEAAEARWARLYAEGKASEADRPESCEDDTWEPPLQSLLFWSEAWRLEHGYLLDQRPTIASEANFIRWCLNWAWENEAHFEDFARDVAKARRRLEEVLSEGRRAQRGVQCFDCQTDLIRPSRDRREHKHCSGHEGVCGWPHKFCAHDRGGLADEWLCPRCDRRYDVEAYLRAVRHAHFVHADFLTLDDAAERTGVKAGTIRVWANRGKVGKRRDVDSGRMTYNVRDIEARHADSVDVA